MKQSRKMRHKKYSSEPTAGIGHNHFIERRNASLELFTAGDSTGNVVHIAQTLTALLADGHN